MTRSKRNYRIAIVLLSVSSLISVCLLKAETSRWDRDGAHEAFLKAESIHRQLNRNPESARSEYLRCAQTYRQVYFKDPHYPRAADAIYSEGLLYEKIAEISEDSSYYCRLAIKRFEFLLSDYGGSGHRKEARKRIEALNAFFAGSTDEAKPEAASGEMTVTPKEPEKKSGNHRVTVQDVRHGMAGKYGRLTIYLDSDTDLTKRQVTSPDRIYFDLAHAVLSEGLHGKVLSVQDPFLKQVRIGQFNPDVVRIVLDLTSFPTCSVSRLEDPARIVVDLKQNSANSKQPNQAVSATNDKSSHEEAAKAQIASQTGIESPKAPMSSEITAEYPKTRKTSEIAAATPLEPIPAAVPAENLRTDPVLNLAGKTVPLEGILHRDSPDPPKPSEPTALGNRSLTRVLGLKIGKIVIDPGHGGHDLGTVGSGGMLEKDLVLKLAVKLRKMLQEKLAAEVVLTREQDVFVSLEERTETANRNKADLFISIHANSSRSKSISGVETYYLDFAKTETERTVAARENAGTGSSIHELEAIVSQITRADKAAESEELASVIQNSLYEKARTVFSSTQNRGVRSAPFIVLIGAKMPSILTEVAFISNPRDERMLNEEENLDRLAEALFQGIETYMKKLGNYPIAYRTAPDK